MNSCVAAGGLGMLEQRLLGDGFPSGPNPETWIAFGDSLVEGMTYPLWLSQSLAKAGRPTPEWVNAGIGGNTAGMMLARFDQDVLAYHPKRVFFNCGINDLMTGQVTPFAANVAAMLSRLKKEGISVCVNSTPAMAGEHMVQNKDLVPINAILREQATQYGFEFANVFDPFMKGLKEGRTLNEPDHIHLNCDGYAIYTTAVLKAVAPGVPLSQPWAPQLERGVLPQWKVSVLENPTQSWTINVPEAAPVAFWWKDQERKRGYVLNLRDRAPEAKNFVAQGSFHLDADTPVILKVGGQVKELSLDGKVLPLLPTTHTWGIRIGNRTGVLAAGDHTVEVKVLDGDTFFVAALPVSA